MGSDTRPAPTRALPHAEQAPQGRRAIRQLHHRSMLTAPPQPVHPASLEEKHRAAKHPRRAAITTTGEPVSDGGRASIRRRLGHHDERRVRFGSSTAQRTAGRTGTSRRRLAHASPKGAESTAALLVCTTRALDRLDRPGPAATLADTRRGPCPRRPAEDDRPKGRSPRRHQTDRQQSGPVPEARSSIC